MPVYEFHCRKCGERFEVVQAVTDRPLKKHADCGGPVQKVFHPAGIIFKGSGFYSTDSRRKRSDGDGSDKKETKKEKEPEKGAAPSKDD